MTRRVNHGVKSLISLADLTVRQFERGHYGPDAPEHFIGQLEWRVPRVRFEQAERLVVIIGWLRMRLDNAYAGGAA